MSIIVEIYYENQKKMLSDYETVDSEVFVSKFKGLSLSEYYRVKKNLCETNHTKKNCDCKALINVALTVLNDGICSLSGVFKHNFPTVTYHSFNAKRRLLQMPIVIFPVCCQLYVMEKVEGLSYIHLSKFLTSKLTINQAKQGMTKEDLKKLLLIASNDKERECIKYAVYKSSGITPTQARLKYGLGNMAVRASRVESCVAEAEEIIKAYDDIYQIQRKALLDSDYYQDNDSNNSREDEGSSEDDDARASCASLSNKLPDTAPLTDDDMLVNVLSMSQYNWFSFVATLQDSKYNVTYAILQSFFLKLPNMNGINKEALDRVVQSHRAYVAAELDFEEEGRIARSVNGEIVTDSDAGGFSDTSSMVMEKKKLKLSRKARRLKVKALAERRFLSRKVLKKTSKLIKEYPNIGQIIEDYVKDHNVGADSWRRTGVLTFDGNVHLKDKVTYGKIQKHLESVMGRKIAYGTVVELCIPRNKHRRSAKRYKGLAQVTTRCARKGFNLRFNPDQHWSAAWYKGLNDLHYKDGLDILNLNRDDAAGFRLDTMTTCKQYSTPTVHGSAVLTTRTDYVNRHPSILQTTSYNFSGTKNTGEVCAGVVKAVPVHFKNPAQHYSDLVMLSKTEELKPVFSNTATGQTKPIDCIRVDGAGDEGPTHEVVQYFWTDWHVNNSKVATLVTTRCSGSSYLNRVELQNGCLSLGHANTFIPSTMAGCNIDPETGNIDQAKLKENLNLAITAYVSRVSGCSCGDTTIQLFRGSNSDHLQTMSSSLDTFLKGSKKQKEALQYQQPEVYGHFQKVWDIRNRHMVKNLPPYLFFLKCCFERDCPHPVCQSGESVALRWYPGGPTVDFLPFPFPDPKRSYGGSCDTCKSFCCGHYITKLINITNPQEVKSIVMPPSVVLKESFASLKQEVTDIADVECPDLAKKVLLSEEETKIWLNHLENIAQNRKRGAAKAALTRQTRKNKVNRDSGSKTYCGTCKVDYNKSKSHFWICCDLCEQWYTAVHVNICCLNQSLIPHINVKNVASESNLQQSPAHKVGQVVDLL